MCIFLSLRPNSPFSCSLHRGKNITNLILKVPSEGPDGTVQFIHIHDKPSYREYRIPPPPPSDTTEIADTDFDSDSSDYYLAGNSPSRSVGSVSALPIYITFAMVLIS